MFSTTSPKERTIYTCAGFLTLLAAIYFGARSLRPEPEIRLDKGSPNSNAQALLSSAPRPTGDPPNDPSPVRSVVHVVGEVAKPGVYEFEPGARVTDAIARAGGSKPLADLDSVNLAALLADGSQLRIPSKSASESSVGLVDPKYSGSASNETYSRTGAGSSRASATKPTAGSVSLNTATKSDLDRLPGVGPATAQKILEYRMQAGGFSSIDELLSVKGIGPKKLAAMRKYLRL